MPYMDGMEMISRLQEMYPTMKYIVLSGYDDFIYVKQALQRQVLDYLLKPLSAQGIMKVLRRAKEQLDEQDRQRVNLEILRDKVAKNAQQLRRLLAAQIGRFLRPAGGGIAPPPRGAHSVRRLSHGPAHGGRLLQGGCPGVEIDHSAASRYPSCV